MMKQEVPMEKSVWLQGARALIEGALKLPDMLEEIAAVLDVSAEAELTSLMTLEGCIAIEGVARFTVLYADRKGELASFDSECQFKHTFDCAGAAPGMSAVGELCAEDVSFKLVDAKTVSIRAELSLDVRATEIADIELLDPDSLGGDVEKRCQEASVPRLESQKQVKSYVQSELRVPQSMPPVKRVLLSRGYAVVRTVHREDDRAIVEGEIRLSVVYLSADKNAPLQHIAETIPFGEIVSGAACAEGRIFATCALEHLSVGISEEDGDLLDISGIVDIGVCCWRMRNLSVVQDMYSRTCACEPECIPVKTCVWEALECQKKILRLSVEISQGMPEVARVLYAHGTPKIDAVRPEQDRVAIEGSMHIAFCYTTAEAGIRSARVAVPFETEIALAGVTADSAVAVRARGEYTVLEGSGRELEAKCCLDICPVLMDMSNFSAVADVHMGEVLEDAKPGIVVYFADGEENLWDIAKKFRVRQETLRAVNGELGENVPRGTKLILVK